MTDHWSLKEVELIVADYFSMLVEEMAGNAINKTHHRNALKSLLNGRSDGSIEFKHQNISAVMIKLGLPFIKGYKPKSNYQQILVDAVLNQLTVQKRYLEPKFVGFADSSASSNNKVDFSSLVEVPPFELLIFFSKSFLAYSNMLNISTIPGKRYMSLLSS